MVGWFQMPIVESLPPRRNNCTGIQLHRLIQSLKDSFLVTHPRQHSRYRGNDIGGEYHLAEPFLCVFDYYIGSYKD